jgi:hypothetical protein
MTSPSESTELEPYARILGLLLRPYPEVQMPDMLIAELCVALAQEYSRGFSDGHWSEVRLRMGDPSWRKNFGLDADRLRGEGYQRGVEDALKALPEEQKTYDISLPRDQRKDDMAFGKSVGHNQALAEARENIQKLKGDIESDIELKEAK